MSGIGLLRPDNYDFCQVLTAAAALKLTNHLCILIEISGADL
jgi:hypothetical protein